MKKILLLFALVAATVGLAAQTSGNTLVVKSKNEDTKFILYVSGAKINKEPQSKVVLTSVYADEVLVKIEVGDKKLEQRVELSPIGKNALQSRYAAVYELTEGRKKLVLKRKSLNKVEFGETAPLPEMKKENR